MAAPKLTTEIRLWWTSHWNTFANPQINPWINIPFTSWFWNNISIKKKQIPVFYSWWSMPPYQLLVNQNKKSRSNLFCLKSHCRLPRLSWSVRSIYFLPCFLSLHMETFIQKTYSNPQKDRKSASRMVVPWCSSPITSRFPNCSIIPELRPRKNSRLGGTLFYDQLGGNRHNWEAPKKC